MSKCFVLCKSKHLVFFPLWSTLGDGEREDVYYLVIHISLLRFDIHSRLYCVIKIKSELIIRSIGRHEGVEVPFTFEPNKQTEQAK